MFCLRHFHSALTKPPREDEREGEQEGEDAEKAREMNEGGGDHDGGDAEGRYSKLTERPKVREDEEEKYMPEKRMRKRRKRRRKKMEIKKDEL